MSFETRSSGWPECSAMISSRRRLTLITSRAWISISVACPSKPPESWCSRIFAFGSATRFPLRAAGQEQGAHRHRDPDTRRLDVGPHELHRVVDREPGVDRAAGRVDVDRDVGVRLL